MLKQFDLLTRKTFLSQQTFPSAANREAAAWRPLSSKVVIYFFLNEFNWNFFLSFNCILSKLCLSFECNLILLWVELDFFFSIDRTVKQSANQCRQAFKQYVTFYKKAELPLSCSWFENLRWTHNFLFFHRHCWRLKTIRLHPDLCFSRTMAHSTEHITPNLRATGSVFSSKPSSLTTSSSITTVDLSDLLQQCRPTLHLCSCWLKVPHGQQAPVTYISPQNPPFPPGFCLILMSLLWSFWQSKLNVCSMSVNVSKINCTRRFI